MKDFNSYWKKKAEKRRKSWVAKSKRYAEQHTQLEDIRKEVFLPIDYAPGYEPDDYKVPHYTKRNPIVEWNQGKFKLSESGLREAIPYFIGRFLSGKTYISNLLSAKFFDQKL